MWSAVVGKVADTFFLSGSGTGERGLADAVDFAKSPEARLADHGDRVAGKEFFLASGPTAYGGDVVLAIFDRQRVDAKPV